MKLLCCAIALCVLLICCNSTSGEKVPADDSMEYYPPTPQELDRNEFRLYYRQLSDFFDTTLLNKNFNGSILVAKNGSVIYEKYRGLIDLRKPDSINANTALHIASTSKTFTAVAILQLVQQNKISFDDSLTTFFPQFPYRGITVKMLLNHRSGLPNYLYFMSNYKWGILPNGQWDKKMATNDDVIKTMIDRKPDVSFSPGTRFNYCNTNYVLLASIIEKVTGQKFPEYMQQTIFTPLQMKYTYVFSLKDLITAAPSFTNKGTYWEYDFLDATYGDKNIYTTAQDLLKWDQALYTDQILSKDLLEAAFTPYSFEKPTVHNYGLGWRLQILPNGKKVVYHFGKWHGCNAAFARLLDEKVTIIILGNRFTSSTYNAAHHTYDFFGEYLQRQVPDADELDSIKQKLLEPPAKKSPAKRKR